MMIISCVGMELNFYSTRKPEIHDTNGFFPSRDLMVFTKTILNENSDHLVTLVPREAAATSVSLNNNNNSYNNHINIYHAIMMKNHNANITINSNANGNIYTDTQRNLNTTLEYTYIHIKDDPSVRDSK